MRRRDLAANETRSAIVNAVHRLLDATDASDLRLEDVARAAGVTRATVYNHFGSRRALLTAAFADQGRLIGFDRVVAAISDPNPRRALRAMLREVARAWDTRPRAIARVLALATLDPEIGKVVRRFEHARRAQIARLARRLGAPAGAREAGEILGALTHPLTYYQFRATASARVAARRLQRAAAAALGFTGRRPATGRG